MQVSNQDERLKKMSLESRISHNRAQRWNANKTNIRGGLILAEGLTLTAAATYGVSKSPKLQNLISKGGSAIKNSKIGKAAISGFSEMEGKILPYAKRAIKGFLNLPGAVKAVAIIGTLLTIGAVEKNDIKGYRESGVITYKHATNEKTASR